MPGEKKVKKTYEPAMFFSAGLFADTKKPTTATSRALGAAEGGQELRLSSEARRSANPCASGTSGSGRMRKVACISRIWRMKRRQLAQNIK